MAIINTYPTATPKASDLLIGTQVKDDTIEENSTKSFSAGSVAALALNYKSYVIALTQSSANDPVITEFQNNTGITITWVRQSPGVYDGTPDTSFDTTKTWVQVTGGTSEATTLHLKTVSNSKIRLTNLSLDGTTTPTDGLDNGYLELRIYS